LVLFFSPYRIDRLTMSASSLQDTTNRFSDVIKEPCVLLTPIEGFNKMKLVTLEEACLPLLSIVPRIQTYAHVAKQRAKDPADGLSADESASIALYTMEWYPSDESVYYILNETLRSADRRKLKPWFLYLKLILTALSRLEPVPANTTVYRGVKSSLNIEDENYQVGNEIFWWGFSSCSKEENISGNNQFLGETGARTLFIIKCLNGKDISKHSYFRNEHEVLLLPATLVRITKNETSADNVRTIHLQEIESSLGLIEKVSTETEIKDLKKRSGFLKKVFSSKTPSNQDADRYTNPKLSADIAMCKIRSRNYFNGRRYNENDLKIIVQQLILEKQCQELSLRETRIDCQGASILAKSLQNNIYLENLIISYNSIGDTGAQALAQALSGNNNHTLKQLSLGHNEITDNGAKYLAQMLETNRTLTHLFLPNNEITDQGLKYLVNVLLHPNKTLQVLSLERNKFRDESTVNLLVSLLRTNQTLTSLNVDSCKLSRTAVKQLQSIAEHKPNFQLIIQ